MIPPRLPVSPALLRAVWGRRSLPFFLKRAARRYGDVLQLRRGIWLASHPELARQILVANPTSWSKAQGVEKTKRLLGEGLLGSSGETHRARRRLLQPLFASARLPLYADTVVSCALETRESWRNEEVVDISAQMSSLALSIVTRSVFGAGLDGSEAKVAGALDEAMRLFNGAMTPLGDWFERLPHIAQRFERARAQLDEIVFALIESKRREGARSDDVLSVLLRARDEDGQGLGDEAVRDEAMTLLLAGHETTANALTFSWWFLSRHPAAREKLEREADEVLNGCRATFDDLRSLVWTRAVLSETMRLLPPAWMVGRRALRDVTLDFEGHELCVPAGTTVLVSAFLLHRDARFWNEPRRFDPSRWNGDFEPTKWSYLPFGAGHRACLAENFAWMEATLSLATLAQNFRARAVSPLALEPSVTLRPRGQLLMRLERR